MTYSLQRTNPRIASNIKLVVDQENKLFLETISSNFLLERSIYKGFEYSKQNTWGENIRYFSSQFADKSILYDVVDESLINASNETSSQYHQKYDWGAYSDNSKILDGNYRFFAPIHIEPGSQKPQTFVVFKISRTDNATTGFNSLSDYLNDAELVATWDLTEIGNIFDQIEESSIDMQFEEGTTTTGLSINSGLMVSKSETIIEAMLANESTITEFENNITNNYREHQLIYSNVINLEFIFDDISDDQFVRYVGMYVNHNETTTEIIDQYENVGVIRLCQTENGLIKYNNDQVLNSYDVIQQSQRANSFGTIRAPQIEIVVSLKPLAGTELVVKYNDEIEHTIVFDNNTPSDVNSIAEYIANELETNYDGRFSALTTFVENNSVVLRSSSINLNAERLSVELPSTIYVKRPQFISETITYSNNFVGGTEKTVSLKTYFNPQIYNKLQYIDDNNNTIVANVLMPTLKCTFFLCALRSVGASRGA